MTSRWSRLAPLTGVVFVVLLVVANLALAGTEPKNTATAASVIAFYHAHRSQIQLSAYLNGLAIIAALFFYAILREHLSSVPRTERLATTAFAGAVVFATGGALVAGTGFALADVPGSLSPAAAQALNVLGNDLSIFAVGSGAAVLTLASGLAILRGRQLPIWLGWAAIAVAVAAILPVPSISLPFVGLWTLVVSVVLTRRPATPTEPELLATRPATAQNSARTSPAPTQ